MGWRKTLTETTETTTEGDDGEWNLLFLLRLIVVVCLLVVPLITTLKMNSASEPQRNDLPTAYDKQQCLNTCSLSVVESIPENVTFGSSVLPQSTFSAWRSLIVSAKREIQIAAYKSSLRGKHVLHDSHPAALQGEEIFELLVSAGLERQVPIRMVENFPPKDRGDNSDGRSLAKQGAIEHRKLHLAKVLGAGTMHSKFIVIDRQHFYLGSANLDWRSLNQKMELGVLLNNCPCIADDLSAIFSSYWDLTMSNSDDLIDISSVQSPKAYFNRENPLTIMQDGVKTEIYLATSPKILNAPGRTWDLDAILSTINNAQRFAYIHVMDYIPMFVYRQPQEYWPVIDDAIRRAVIERGVEVKMLVAALHFVPQTMRFLRSLQSLNGMHINGSIQVKIFKVPTDAAADSLFARERRTHNKCLVTEDTAVIGTSNWSGDYFVGNTGVALVMSQKRTVLRPLISELKGIFVRDWDSDYAHTIDLYTQRCLISGGSGGDFCQMEKNPQHLDRSY